MKNAPKDEKRDMKLNKFKEHYLDLLKKFQLKNYQKKLLELLGKVT